MSERTQRMARMYTEEGMSYSEIGARFDLSRQRVHQLIGELVEARPRSAPIQRRQVLAEAYGRVMRNESTLPQEAQELGYASEASIRAAMARSGMTFSGRPNPRQRVLAAHGTAKRYRQEPCRCDECRAANTVYNRSLRERRGEPPNHSASGYRNYGCRCKVCTEAHSIALREYRARTRRQRPRRGSAAAGRRISS